MGITAQHFQRTLVGLQQLRQFAKPLDEAGLLLAWVSFPEAAKRELTDAHLTYAASQMLLDPNPPKDVPLHLQTLRYLYRLRDGAPALDWGLKADLGQRMANPSQFHAVTGSSEHERIATQGVPELDGPRYSPHGVLAGGF